MLDPFFIHPCDNPDHAIFSPPSQIKTTTLGHDLLKSRFAQRTSYGSSIEP